MTDKLDSPAAAPQDQHQHHHRPLKLARTASNNDNDDASSVTMASRSPLTLGLGLSSASTAKPLFTFMQLQELEHQALIYKYMAAGLPVPVHLVLPIWKSVAASSFGPFHFPSLMGYGSLCLDYRNSMEPEPGRCRRTDGKKWRCSRDVVPDQKYCERHMHRGRNRSRKPVETAAAAPPAEQQQLQLASSTAAHLPAVSSSGPRGVLKLLPSPAAAARNASVSPPRLGFSPTSVLGLVHKTAPP